MRVSKGAIVSRKIFPVLVLAALAATAGVSHAQQQGQSMEERLRAQLRITTSQLQQAQNELAALKAGPSGAAAAPAAGAPASKSELEALKKELAQSQQQLAAERHARGQASAGSEQVRQQAQATAEKAGAQVAQYRGAYDDLLKMARASEAERQRLAAEATTQRTALTQCEAKNAQLYAVGQEILRAYETVDLGSVLASRQPFAAQSRVKFDVRAVNAPAPAAAAPAAPAAPAQGEKQ